MPLDPSISLAVRPVKIEDPLSMYGKIAAIQGAQQQNALAQFQMQQAQREQEATNALNQAYRDAYNSQTGDIDTNRLRNSLTSGGYGSKLPEIEKRMGEARTQRLAQMKSEGELFDAALKRSRGFLETLDPDDPNAARDYIAWNEANHRDPIIGPVLAARGITSDQSRDRIMREINKPGGLARLIKESKSGAEKFMEMNKPSTHVIDQNGQRQVIQIPGQGGAPTTVGIYADVPMPASVEAQKSRIAKAGATNVSVSTERKYGERFGGLVAEADAAKLAAAEKAPEAAAIADRVIDLIETGNVITGMGANARLQLAKALNLAGSNDSERIRNTEVLVSSLADTTLGAIKSSGLGSGQGFTNTDREFLEKAKAGQLSYDAKSLMQLARLSRLAAEKSADAWNTRVKQIPSAALEGTGIPTEPVIVPKRGKSTPNISSIPKDAIRDLKSGLGTAEEFDSVFGKGAAAKILKGT